MVLDKCQDWMYTYNRYFSHRVGRTKSPKERDLTRKTDYAILNNKITGKPKYSYIV